MRKNLFVAALAASIALPAIVVPIEVEAATYSKTFKDVSQNSPYYDSIHTMTEKGIISGYEDGTFKPNEILTRKHAAALINRVVSVKPLNLPLVKHHPDYGAIHALVKAGLLDENAKGDMQATAPKDLPKNNAYYNDIMKLVNAGLLEVDPKGNINPNAPLTRGEMAKILAVAFELQGNIQPPKDVSNKYYEYVAKLYAHEITTGYADGTFKENGSLTRAHYAVFMYRAMGLGVQAPKNISMDSTEKEINSYIKSSPLFKKGVVAHPTGLTELKNSYKKVIVHADDILAGTNLKVKEISGAYFSFEQDNWKPVDRLSHTQISYVSGRPNESQSISFDYSLSASQVVAKRILTTVFAKELDTIKLGHLIDEKVAEALVNKDKIFTNVENIEIGKYKVQFGVIRDDEYASIRDGKADFFKITIEQ